ncbi:GNAT family protein [Pullulanibacillus sp. KACC 23026]|uniref:GNAT family N-acetyltransferase n=1 Tax=Pullulanibacillus sp. KACC 23026 TaxID=3028315 RepID=UPI0023AEF773|nr:GNAT family protein [Pullulanibacillus sp. KACC 23026]WEG12541.1 GNAT family protein [Pullulanibacillus sp. KACC 23026]
MLRDLFKSDRLCLTGKYEEDAEVMALWSEDSEYLRNVDTDFAAPLPASVFQDSDERDLSHVSFRIRLLEDKRLIGFGAIHSIEWGNGIGVLSIGIGQTKDRGQGYGTEALNLLLQYAFLELNLHRVGLDVISYNKSAIRLYENAGFVEEGRIREAVYRDNQRYDRIYMGLFRKEWLKK